MRFERLLTKENEEIYDNIPFRSASSEIRNPDGTIVFSVADIEVPEQYSQVATDIISQKYFRKACVAARLKKIEENGMPSWLWRSKPFLKMKDTLERLLQNRFFIV